MLCGELSSCGSGHSGCCSPGLCEQKRSQDGLGFSHAALSGHTPGLASCESGMCFGNQRAFRVLQSWSARNVSEISGHSGCCSPGLCEQKRSQDGLGFSHAALSGHTPGLASCESGMCFGNQRAFRVLQSWSAGNVSEISGHSGCCSPGLCEQKRSQDGLGFSHAALSGHTPGLASCESGMCFGNQRAFRVLQSWSARNVSEISGHSGCCSPGLASCESGMCFGNQRAFRVLQSWSARNVSEITPGPKVSTCSL